MHANSTSEVTYDLTVEERRTLVKAAWGLVRLSVPKAAIEYGTHYPNVLGWTNGKDNKLSFERQLGVLKMFGLTPYGQLRTDVLHNWLTTPDHVGLIDTLLTYETDLQDVKIAFAYAPHVKFGVRLVGAAISWTSDFITERGVLEPRERRLILTALAGMWSPEGFIAAVNELFRRKARHGKVKVGPDITVSHDAASNIWRWDQHSPSRAERSMANKRNALLPFTQDIVQPSEAPSSVREILNELVLRLEKLVKEHAKLRRQTIGPHDLRLIKRAKSVLNEASDEEVEAK